MTGRQRFASVALGVLAGIVASAGVLAVTAAAFALSFDAIRFTAQAAHIRASLAWLFPVAVDGAMAVAVVAAVVLRRLGRSAVYPWLVVLFGALVSIVANALHAWVEGGAVALPPAWAMALSAVPPVLLALSVHLLVVLALATLPTEVPAQDATPSPELVAPAVPDTPAELLATPPDAQEEPAPPAPRKRAAPRRSNRDRVVKLAAKMPSASTAELAAKLRVSEATVRRYRPAPPDGLASANGRAHGEAPELVEVAGS